MLNLPKERDSASPKDYDLCLTPGLTLTEKPIDPSFARMGGQGQFQKLGLNHFLTKKR